MTFRATKNNEAALGALRAARTALLAATDFVFLPDVLIDPTDKDAILSYRKALRDCTNPPPGVVAAIPSAADFGIRGKLKDELDRIYRGD